MKQFFFLLALTTITLFFISCANKPFDYIEPTEDEQYSIVYKDGLCGIYDNYADSLVTKIRFDAVYYNHLSFVTKDTCIDVYSTWDCDIANARGLVSIKVSNNNATVYLYSLNENYSPER